MRRWEGGVCEGVGGENEEVGGECVRGSRDKNGE